jgi:hypothetical protein
VLEYRNSIWTALKEDRTLEENVTSARTVQLTTKGSKTKSPLRLKERTLLRFWQERYQELLDEIPAWHRANERDRRIVPQFCCNGLLFYPQDSLGQHLLPFVNAHREHLMTRTASSARNTEEKEFLALYLRYALAEVDLQNFDTEDMQRRTAKYLTDHPVSPRAQYVRKVLDYRYRPWGMGVGGHLYTGRSTFQGNVARHFNDTWTIGVDLEIGYGRILLKSGFGGGFGRPVREPFTYNDTLYAASGRANLDHGEALLGYAVVDSKKIRLSPFSGVSEFGFGMKDNKGEVTYHGRQIGIDLDLKVDHWDATRIIATYGSSFMAKQNKGHSALRIRVGYERLFNEQDDGRLGGAQIIVRVGYGCYQGAGRRSRTWKHRN